MTPCAGNAGKEKQVHSLLPLTMKNNRCEANVDLTCSPNWHPVEIRMAECYTVSRRNQSIPVRETTFSLCSDEGRADYKTDYIPAGRYWTTLDDAPPRTAISRAIWTYLDASGHRAECSTTAGHRCDSCPTCLFRVRPPPTHSNLPYNRGAVVCPPASLLRAGLARRTARLLPAEGDVQGWSVRHRRR